MSVLTPIIATWDGANRRAYMAQGSTDFYPIEDIYHEYRNQRRLDEELRKYEPMLKAAGNVPKGAGAFTPRYVVLLDGFKIIPYNETIQINQLGDMITDDPDIDPTLYDTSGLTVPKVIYIKPSEAETIQLNSAAIEYSSYGDVVSVNLSSPYDGIDYPTGNKEYNVNNIQDGVTICNNKGFDVLRIKGLVPLVLGDDVSYKTIQGNNPLTAILNVHTDALTLGVICENLTFSGTLDGDAILEHCVLGEVYYFNGYINDCALTSNTIFVNGIGLFMNCRAGATCESPPIIDLANATGLGIRDFVGDLIVTNKIGVGKCKIALTGELTIDASCSAGSITVYGDGYVTNNGTGTFELIDRTTGTPQEIAQATLDAGVATSQQVQNAAML